MNEEILDIINSVPALIRSSSSCLEDSNQHNEDDPPYPAANSATVEHAQL